MNKKQCVYVSAGLLGAWAGSLAFLFTAIVTAVAMVKAWPRGAFVAGYTSCDTRAHTHTHTRKHTHTQTHTHTHTHTRWVHVL